MTTNGEEGSFGVMKCSETDCDDGCMTLNVLKTIELYTSNRIMWFANHISIIFKKNKPYS